MEENTTYMFPTSIKEVKALGWDYIDVILFTGDAFIDHPSFGTAVIARWLQKHGYRVAVVPQPNWKQKYECKKCGGSGHNSATCGVQGSTQGRNKKTKEK